MARSSTTKRPATKPRKNLPVYVIQNGKSAVHIGSAATKGAARKAARTKGYAVYPDNPVEKYDAHVFGGEHGRDAWGVLVTGKTAKGGHRGGFKAETDARKLAHTITLQGRKASVKHEGTHWFVQTSDGLLGQGGKVVG